LIPGKSVKLFSSLGQPALGWQNFFTEVAVSLRLKPEWAGGAGFRPMYLNINNRELLKLKIEQLLISEQSKLPLFRHLEISLTINYEKITQIPSRQRNGIISSRDERLGNRSNC